MGDSGHGPGIVLACRTCPRACRLAPGQAGACRARANRDGEVVALNYGKLTAMALDPVEKKPLAMWQPGKKVLSVGSFGCNLKCPFCQNWEIACAGLGDVAVRQASPDDLVDAALRTRPLGNVGLAFTYNEPLVGWEFVRDTAQIAHEHGLQNVLVTNGMASLEVLREVLPFLDAVNVDLKGFSAEFYAMCLTGSTDAGADGAGCGAGPAGFELAAQAGPRGCASAASASNELGKRALDVVKGFIEAAVEAPGCHVEVTTLVVPGSDFGELEEAAKWLASLDRGIPYHVTQYHPAHRWASVGPLPNRAVRAIARRAGAYLDNVFTGNL